MKKKSPKHVGINRVKDWKILSRVCTAPYLIFIPLFYKFVPESIKWLYENGRLDEVHNIVSRIAYWNKKSVPKKINILPVEKRTRIKTNPLDLFRPRSTALMSVVQGNLWAFIAMAYYSLHLASNDLGGSVYRDFTILCMAETIGYPLSIIASNVIGRKKAVLVPSLFGSLLCLTVAFVPRTSVYNAVRISTGIIGNICLTTAFTAVYIWSVELYPVMIRSQGMGYLQLVAHWTSGAAPLVTKGLKHYGNWCPFVAIGLPALIATGIAMWLPETYDESQIGSKNKDMESKNKEIGIANKKKKDKELGVVIINNNTR